MICLFAGLTLLVLSVLAFVIAEVVADYDDADRRKALYVRVYWRRASLIGGVLAISVGLCAAHWSVGMIFAVMAGLAIYVLVTFRHGDNPRG